MFASQSSSQGITIRRSRQASLWLLLGCTLAISATAYAQPNDAMSTVDVNMASIPADGVTTATVTVTLLDDMSAAVAGETVLIFADTNPAGVLIDAITDPPVSDPAGQVQFAVSAVTPGMVTFRAIVLSQMPPLFLTDTAMVDFTTPAVDAGMSTVTADQTPVVADGIDDTTVTITLRDANGLALAGQSVRIDARNALNNPAPGVTPANSTGVTNALGQFSATFTSTIAGLVRFVGVLDPAGTPSDLPTVANVVFSTNGPDATLSRVELTDATATVDGADRDAAVLVTLLNSAGNPIPGRTVELNVVGNTNSATITINTSPTVTNAAGQALFMVRADRVTEATVRAIDTTPNPDITLTPDVMIPFVLATGVSADLLSVESFSNQVVDSVFATFSYTVHGLSETAPYNIILAVDPDGAGPDPVVNFTPPGDRMPGVHSSLTNIAAALTDQVQDGGTVTATLGLDDGTLGDNTRIGSPLRVDIFAAHLAYNNVTRIASLTYVITSPARLQNFAVIITRDGDPGVQLMAPLTPVDRTVGSHTISAVFPPGQEPAAGETVRARVDAMSEILESNELNNEATTVNTVIDDSFISAVTTRVSAADTTVNVAYAVSVAGAIAPYNIQIGLDNGNGIFNPLAVVIPGVQANGQQTTGDISIRAALNALAPAIFVADGAQIVARMGPLGTEIGVNEGRSAPLTVDIVAQSVQAIVQGSETLARVRYSVDSPANTAPHKIRIGLNNTAGGLLLEADGFVAPGDYTQDFPIRGALNARTVKNADVLRAELDTANAVDEGSDANNNSSDNLVVNLQAISVSVIPEGVYQTTVTYLVDSVANVAPFNIALNRAGVTLATIAGDPTPGTHTQVVNLGAALRGTATPAGSAFVVSAVIDAANAVVESSELDNATNATESRYNVDLRADSLVVPGIRLGQAFDAAVSYTVLGSDVNENFTIGVYASNDDALTVSSDTLIRKEVVNAASLKGVGSHTIAITGLTVSNGDVNRGNFFIIIRLDDDNVVNETDNLGNNLLRQQNGVGGDPATTDLDLDGLFEADERAGFDIAGVRRADRSPDQQQVAREQTLTVDDNADTDGDGIGDFVERNTGTNPNDIDTDADGIPDGTEDSNGNGVVDDGETDPRNWDTDGDFLSDLEECDRCPEGGFLVTQYGANANSGRFNQSTTKVVRVWTSALSADSDGDGISDWDEVNTWAVIAFGSEDANGNGNLDEGEDIDNNGELNDVSFVTLSIGLADTPARRDAGVNKPLHGIRTDPTNPDSDGDGINDADDPAPQINPARWGFDQNGDRVFDNADIQAIRDEIANDTSLSTDARNAELNRIPTPGPGAVAAFQRALIDFDQDGDGFLEAPDANGDGVPDFTRYNELTIEQAFGIDFSNDGTLVDGFDIGGLGRGAADVGDTRNGAVAFFVERFGTYRVVDGGDGRIDTLDDNGLLMPTDNCPTASNADQLDFDGDGLGDECDADRDNDGVSNNIDPVLQAPSDSEGTRSVAPLCGLGAVQAMAVCLAGLAMMQRRGRRF